MMKKTEKCNELSQNNFGLDPKIESRDNSKIDFI